MKLIKEIVSQAGVLHFQRFAIFQSKYFSIYLHKIYKADEDEHCHNHPWKISTFILKGAYIEEIHKVGENLLLYRKRFNFATRERQKFHKIKKLLSPMVTTLAFVIGKREEWGYMVDGRYIDNVTYRKIKNKEI